MRDILLRDRKLATTVLRTLFDIGGSLDRSIAVVKAKGSTAEFNAYRAAVGQVMGELWVRTMAPLLQAHPSLAPKALHAEGQQEPRAPKSRPPPDKHARPKRRKSGSATLRSKRLKSGK